MDGETSDNTPASDKDHLALKWINDKFNNCSLILQKGMSSINYPKF